MTPEIIQSMIEAHLPQATVQVQGDGRHFEAIVVASIFEGKNLLARQRMVYSALGDHLHSGAIHALTIKAKTPSELLIEKQNNHG